MRPSLPHLASRIFNRPVLITPSRARAILSVLGPRLGVGSLVEVEASGVVTHGAEALGREAQILQSRGPGQRKVYDVVNGVAVIPIEGTLVNKTGTIDPYSGMTGYDGLTVKLTEAYDDAEVRAIMLDIDSGGGEVAGCFDLVDLIHANQGRKPVWSVLSEDAYSAAYAIASAADRIIVPATGGVGSIGVVCLHADYSGQLAESGVKVTLIHAGAHKVDGNPYEPLPTEVRDEIQAEIDQVRETFADRVARGRPALPERRCLPPSSWRPRRGHPGRRRCGPPAQLKSAVMAPRDAFAVLVEEASRPTSAAPGRQAAGPQQRGKSMNRSEFFGGVASGALLTADASDDDAPAAVVDDGDAGDDEEDVPDDAISATALQAFAGKHPTEARALHLAGAAAERNRIASLYALAEPGEDKLLGKDNHWGLVGSRKAALTPSPRAVARAGLPPCKTAWPTPRSGLPRLPSRPRRRQRPLRTRMRRSMRVPRRRGRPVPICKRSSAADRSMPTPSRRGRGFRPGAHLQPRLTGQRRRGAISTTATGDRNHGDPRQGYAARLSARRDRGEYPVVAADIIYEGAAVGENGAGFCASPRRRRPLPRLRRRARPTTRSASPAAPTSGSRRGAVSSLRSAAVAILGQ